MNTAWLKKIVAFVKVDHSTQDMLELVDALLFVMKKFGKQMDQSYVRDFLINQFPEVYRLYELLGTSRCTRKTCLLLKQYLRESVDGLLVCESTHSTVLNSLSELPTTLRSIWGNESNPTFSAQSSSKIYKRSLQEDLGKML